MLTEVFEDFENEFAKQLFNYILDVFILFEQLRIIKCKLLFLNSFYLLNI